MIREHLLKHGAGERGFVWRGTEVSRLEGFVDAVFGFAVTLLVASLDVPTTYPELMAAMRGLVPFAFCFALLFWVWYQHYRFFRRFALQDTLTHWLSAVLAFVVLFYVYPLRFMAMVLMRGWTGQSPVIGDQLAYVVHSGESATLMTIYSAGFTAVFVVFTMLYFHAYRQAGALELTETERVRTRESIASNVGLVVLGMFSVVLSRLLETRLIGFAGLIYFLIGPLEAVVGMYFGRQIRELERAQAASRPSEDG